MQSFAHNFMFLADSPGLLQFEVCPLTDSSFSVSFQHPVNESLVCGKEKGLPLTLYIYHCFASSDF